MTTTVSVPGVQKNANVYSTISLQYQTQQNANIAVQLLAQIYAAAGQPWANTAGGQLQVLNDDDTPPGGGGANPLVKEFTLGDKGGIQNTGTTDSKVPTGYLGIIDAFTNQTSEIVGAPGQANETVVAGGNMHFYTNDGSGTVISGQGGNLVATNATGPGGDWTVFFDGGDNSVFASSGNFTIFDGNASTTGANLLFIGSGNDVVWSWGQDTIVGGPNGNNLVATFTPGSVFWANTGTNAFVNLGGADTFVAGGGDDTIFAVASGGTYFGNSGSFTFASWPSTSDTVFAGSGNNLIWSGGSGLYFVGAGNFLMVGVGDSQTVVGAPGAHSAVLYATNGDNISLYGSDNSNIMVAGGGSVTLNGAGATGNNLYFGGVDPAGADSIVAGAGNNTLVGGSGSETLVGGAGANVFAIDKAYTGLGGNLNELIVGWNANDSLALVGYGAATVAGGLPAGASANGNVLTLSDGTKITFAGLSNLSGVHVNTF